MAIHAKHHKAFLANTHAEAAAKNWTIGAITPVTNFIEVTIEDTLYLIAPKVQNIGKPKPDGTQESASVHLKTKQVEELIEEADLRDAIPVLGYRVTDSNRGIDDFILITLELHTTKSHRGTVISQAKTGYYYNGTHILQLRRLSDMPGLLTAVRYGGPKGLVRIK